MSTIDEEVKFNPRLRRSRSEFIEIMNNLKLPYPKQIGMSIEMQKSLLNLALKSK